MKHTDRDGVNAVESIFIRELKWIFREQTISDWGIDAHVEVTNRDEPIGRLLAVQIKSGKRQLWFRVVDMLQRRQRDSQKPDRLEDRHLVLQQSDR